MASHGCRGLSHLSDQCPHTHTHQHILIHANANTKLRHCPHCPLHLHHRHCRHCRLHNHHFHGYFQSPPFLPPVPQNQHLFGPLPIANHPSSAAVGYEEANSTLDSQIIQEMEHTELDYEDEDDEPVFVLTDEWREFFAKSEARRKLEKKQGKKVKK